MEFTDTKTPLIDYIERHTKPSPKAGRNMYVCPFCGSGTGKNETGALSVYQNGTRWQCFACNKEGDLGDFIAETEHISKGEGFKRAKALYSDYGANKPVKNAPIKERDLVDFSENIKRWSANASMTNYYIQRGFSQETIKKFNLGFEPATNTAKIPVSKNCVIYRKLDAGADRSKGFDKGSLNTLFNVNDLYNNDKAPVFICEGWADALSVYECGGYAISCNSESMYNLVLQALKQRPTKNRLIISFDTDAPGQKGAEALEKGLLDLGYNPTRFSFNGAPLGVHDMNEYYLKDRKAFEKAIDAAISNATNAKDEYSNNYISEQLDGILSQFKSGKQGAKSTGIKSIDNILGGGLFPGLSIIGAESSQGKSTLAMNIAENMAEAGEDVIYFALEMTKSQIVARGLSKQSYLLSNKKNGFTSADIKENRASNIDDLANAYKNKIGTHLIIVESFTGLTVEEIKNRIKQHISQCGRVPVVVIDYLQMIADNVRQTEKQQIDHSVGILKGLSAEHNMHILAISSLNRASYGEPVKMDAFKESGKIEYTADFVLGLSLSATKQKRLTAQQIDTEMQKQPRAMTLQLLKGRDVETRKCAELRYYSAYNYFEDMPNTWNECQINKTAIQGSIFGKNK